MNFLFSATTIWRDLFNFTGNAFREDGFSYVEELTYNPGFWPGDVLPNEFDIRSEEKFRSFASSLSPKLEVPNHDEMMQELVTDALNPTSVGSLTKILIIASPNLRILHFSQYTTISNFWDLFEELHRPSGRNCAPDMFTKLTTVTFLSQERVQLGNIIRLLSELPSLSNLRLQHCVVTEKDIEWSTSDPLPAKSKLRHIQLLNSAVNKNVICKLARLLIGPCTVRIEWAVARDYIPISFYHYPYNFEPSWDVCYVPLGGKVLSSVNFKVEDRQTCKWRMERDVEWRPDGTLGWKMPAWTKNATW